MTRVRRDLGIDLVCLAALYGWILAYSYPYFFLSMANNFQEIATYNLDSAAMLKAVEGALSSTWFRMRFNDYGHFYFNLVIAVSYIYALFLPLSERVLIFILRLFSLLGGCFTIALVFAFARRYLGRLEAIFAAAVMAFSPAFVGYFSQVKPDTWQVFFLTLSIYFLARAFETGDGGVRRWPAAHFSFVLAAAAAAGAAFGTKYLGIILIPLLVLAGWRVPTAEFSDRFFRQAIKWLAISAAALVIPLALLGYVAQPPHVLAFFLVQPQHIQAYLKTPEGGWSKPYWIIQTFRLLCFFASALCVLAAAAYMAGFNFARHRNLVLKAVILISLGLAFIGTFALTSPWLLWRMDFVAQLYYRSDITGAGTEHAGLAWLPILFGYFGNLPNYVGYGVGALTLFGSAVLLVALGRWRFGGANLPFLLVLAYAAIFILFLVLRVRELVVPYALPVVPALVLLATFGLHEIRALLPRWLGQRKAAAGILALAAVLVAEQAWQGTSILMKYNGLVEGLEPHNRMLGDWFVRCVPPRTRIFTASYSYVPPLFQNTEMGEGYNIFRHANPDIVTIRTSDAADLAENAKLSLSRWQYDGADLAHYYDIILRSGAWHAGPVFGPFQVYAKNGIMMNAACR